MAKYSRKRKRSKITTPDRISDLPDEILASIISALPVRQLLATSILSRRWRSLWTLARLLHFDLSITDAILSHVLTGRGNSGQLSVCRISHLHSHTRPNINSWIPYLSLKTIDKLILHVMPDDTHFDLYQILSIPSLHELNLVEFDFYPCQPRLGGMNLRTVMLKDVLFPAHDDLNTLIGNAPQLERLSLSSCSFNELKAHVTISAQLLKQLEIESMQFSSLNLDVPALITLRLHDLSGLNDISVIAPSLLTLNTMNIVEHSDLNTMNIVEHSDTVSEGGEHYDLSASIRILDLFNKVPNSIAIFAGIRKLIIGILPPDNEHFPVVTSVLPKCTHLQELGIIIHPGIIRKIYRVRGRRYWSGGRMFMLKEFYSDLPGSRRVMLKEFYCLEHHMEHLWIKGSTNPMLESVSLILCKALALKKLVISHRDCTSAYLLEILKDYLLPCYSEVDILLKSE